MCSKIKSINRGAKSSLNQGVYPFKNMSGLNKFFNTVSLPQKIAAWGVAGAVFGAWTWFEQRDNGKILTAAEVHERNMKIKQEQKSSNKQ